MEHSGPHVEEIGCDVLLDVSGHSLYFLEKGQKLLTSVINEP